MILLADSKGPDKVVRMRRLIWAHCPHIPEDSFSHGVAHIDIY